MDEEQSNHWLSTVSNDHFRAALRIRYVFQFRCRNAAPFDGRN